MFSAAKSLPEHSSTLRHAALLELQAAYKRVSDLAIEGGRDLFQTPIISDFDTGYFNQSEEGELLLNPHSINF